jgi:hypothetical protein
MYSLYAADGQQHERLALIIKNIIIIVIITSLLTTSLLEQRPFLRKTDKNPPRGRSADWWVLTTANGAETNGLTCLPKHGGARNNKCLVTLPMTDLT